MNIFKNNLLATLLLGTALAGFFPAAAFGIPALVSLHPSEAVSGTRGESRLQILAPLPNQKIDANLVKVDVDYVPVENASKTPAFLLQLDDRVPVRVSVPTFTFTDVAGGTHQVMARMLDAKDLPVPGTRVQVQFEVENDHVQTGNIESNHGQSHNGPSDRSVTSGSASLPGGPENQTNVTVHEPDPQSRLPLLSVIGFGVLLAGLLSAMKARPGQ